MCRKETLARPVGLSGHGSARDRGGLHKTPSPPHDDHFALFPLPGDLSAPNGALGREGVSAEPGLHEAAAGRHVKLHTPAGVPGGVPPLRWCRPAIPSEELFQCLELCNQAAYYASLAVSAPKKSEHLQLLFAIFPLPCKYADMKSDYILHIHKVVPKKKN